MKLVSKIRQMSLFAGWCAIVAALVLAPQSAVAGEPGDPKQEQPKPQQEQPEQKQEFTKTIKKEFPLHATGTVNLVNKYGKIDVKTWDRDRAKIDVTIVVKAGSESEAQNVFDRIQIDFTNDDAFVKAETVIESNKSSWWSWGSNDHTEFQINYQVFMPANASLDLSNKYGDATVAPLTGKAKVDVKYGNFRLEGVGGDLTVELGYGNGTVVKARDASVNVSYSKLNFADVRDIALTSKYSKLTVDNGANLKAESRYDEFNLTKVERLNCQSRYGNMDIGSAESVVAVAQYTDYKIDQLKDNGDFDLQYGGLRIEHVSKGFSKINLVGKYSDFKLAVEDGASYTLDAATNYAGIAYPSGLNVTYEKDKGTSHEVKGHAGTQNARSAIRASLNYGGLKVKQ
ncbi:MAG: hypothetical protein HY842_11250 [Bacteroidetes bacterium]|nr:hypothetical protein [Bacteroidota bacterium]